MDDEWQFSPLDLLNLASKRLMDCRQVGLDHQLCGFNDLHIARLELKNSFQPSIQALIQALSCILHIMARLKTFAIDLESFATHLRQREITLTMNAGTYTNHPSLGLIQ